MYRHFFKRVFDFFLSLIGILLLSPVFLVLALAIVIDDPGPIFYTQKRVGKNKKLFRIHKFRSMKVKTPELATHLLADPDQYITRVGRFIRKTSLDELPQLFDILIGKLSVIGPRPALWSQDDLIAERDKYGVNDVMPGLTGWAQIHGRDELLIPEKAKLDGDYVAVLKKGGFSAFFMDIRCFFGTVSAVLSHDGVVEGGTGATERAKAENEKTEKNAEPAQASEEQTSAPETAAPEEPKTEEGSLQ